MEKLTGFSIIIGNGIFYIGGYKAGIWFDNNEKLKLNREERAGYGIKIDLCFGNTVRPIGLLWKKGYWNNEELKISDIPEDQWDSYFGEDLASKIRKLEKDRLKHGVYNPWYAKHWGVLRLPKWIPTVFVSVGLGKIWSFYIGSKEYDIDPFTRDITWTNDLDRKRAEAEDPKTKYSAFCPSATSRRTRMT